MLNGIFSNKLFVIKIFYLFDILVSYLADGIRPNVRLIFDWNMNNLEEDGVVQAMIFGSD